MGTKLTREPLIQFGKDGATANFGVFGTLATGTKVTSKTIATLQGNAAWLEGWQDAVIANKRPAYQDFNGLQYVHSYMMCYMFQTGVPEWDATTEYFIGSIVNDGTGGLYKSIQDNNTNHAVSDAAYWTSLGALPQSGIQGSFKNLAGAYASSATVTYSAAQIVLQDSTGNQKLFTGLSSGETANKGTAGPAVNGRDQAGAFSNSTWCYVWAIGKEDGTIDLILSASASAIAGLPTGYTYYGLIGCAFIDGSGNFISFKQTGRRYTYSVWRTMVSGNVGIGSWTTIDTSAFVPSALSDYCYGGMQTNDTSAIANVNTATPNVATIAGNRIHSNLNSYWIQTWAFSILTANTLYWGSNASAYVYIDGFELNKLG